MEAFTTFIKEQETREFIVDFEKFSDMARWQQDHNNNYDVDDQENTITYHNVDDDTEAMLKDHAPKYNATVMPVETDVDDLEVEDDIDVDDAVNEEAFQNLFSKIVKSVNRENYELALNELVKLIKRKVDRYGELPHSLQYYADQIAKSHRMVDANELTQEFYEIGGEEILKAQSTPWEEIDVDAIDDESLKSAMNDLVGELERRYRKTGTIQHRVGDLISRIAKMYDDVSPRALSDAYFDMIPESLVESAPPSEEAEKWIEDNKERFRDDYGDDWEQVLYATAHKLYNDGAFSD